MTVLLGRAVQAPSPVPYRPLAEALCTVVRSGGPPDAPELAPFRTALGRLVPEWRAQRARCGTTPSSCSARRSFASCESLPPTVVFGDPRGPSPADPASSTIIEYLVDNLASEAVLCIAMLRVEEDTAAFQLARRLDARRVCPTYNLSRPTRTRSSGWSPTASISSTAPGEVVAYSHHVLTGFPSSSRNCLQARRRPESARVRRSFVDTVGIRRPCGPAHTAAACAAGSHP